MASPRPRLSPAELEVARALWGLGRGTVREIHAALPHGKDLSFPTVQTYLRRLEAKGYAASTIERRTRIYRPVVRETSVVRRAVDDLLQRLFDGEALPLARHLVERRAMSKVELEELRRLIDQAEESSDD